MPLSQNIPVVVSRDALRCPGCDHECLHQIKVENWFRDEDALDAIHVTCTKYRTAIDSSGLGNPSSRRDGMVIYFECEACRADPVLSISQHKGATLVRWLEQSDKMQLYLLKNSNDQ